MCFNSAQKPEKPKQLTPAPAAPAAPKPTPAPKRLQEPGAAPDIKIGAAKSNTSGQRNRGTQRSSGDSGSLTIGNNQGMSL